MDILSVIENSTSPVWAAFLLGLVFAVDPCPMLTNIAAIGYIGKDIDNKKRVFINGLWYTLGRTLAFGLLGLVLIIILRQGATILHVQEFMAHYGEAILIPFLIIIGILMIIADKIPWLKSGGVSAGKMEGVARKGGLGAFSLGALLSLAFCPTNAVLFFGMLIPMAASSANGYLQPVVFAVATALPVVLVAWVIAFSFQSISRLYGSMSKIGKWVRVIVGVLFILLGVYFIIEHLLFHSH